MQGKLIQKYKESRLYNWLFVAAAILTITTAAAQSPAEALETLLSSNAIDRNQTSLYIWDLEADCKVAAHREAYPITPASVMKCVSTAALQSAISYRDRLKTQVYLEGSTSNGIFTGNIIVVGGGDPSLGDKRHKNQPDFPEAVVKALADKGIKEIHGSVLIDDNLFAGPATHPSWGSGDLEAYYGTGCHAFNYEGNASGKKAVKNPGAVFKKQLLSALQSKGITFNDSIISDKHPKKQLILKYDSPTVGDLMRSCMFRSDNLYAETFLRLFGVQNGTDGSVAESARLSMQHWDALNYPVDAVEIVDGSGLSRDNRLSAEFLGTLLREMKDDPEYVSFFPLVGEEGTVRSFLKDTPLQGYMALKTGSMSGIQSYAGYVLDEDFMPTHVVVVMTNGLKNRDAYKAALANFFLKIFKGAEE